ncbi:MAG TPA: hypothetical protein VIA81_07215 [Acidimicrobiia bacterium]
MTRMLPEIWRVTVEYRQRCARFDLGVAVARHIQGRWRGGPRHS